MLFYPGSFGKHAIFTNCLGFACLLMCLFEYLLTCPDPPVRLTNIVDITNTYLGAIAVVVVKCTMN